MKLYFSPGACSLSPHIVLREAGFDFEIERVDFATKKTGSGVDYSTINPNGYVPALDLGNGEILTEGPAIVQYLADQKPESGLAPTPGTLERARLQEWLAFIGTELHKSYSPLFSPKTPEEHKATVRDTLARRISYVADKLGSKPFLMGDTFTVADAYLFTVLAWGKYVGMPLDPWPTLVAYNARIKERPTVKAAMAAERGK
jgi:glutathione S-transferase